ncbi:hypothetical protein [Pontibacter ruber]|uniref:Lipoprotein n=1 Tax=Pontibacter ruber TaxID=1343895 RepID=A0ABW5CYZ9_9BACT|nr:hypothetical protein [Pontibacter ruber]
MRYLHPFLLILLLGPFLFSCSNDQEGEEKKAPVSVVPDRNSFTVKANFSCEEIRGADEDNPEAVLYLLHNDTQHVIDTISTCSVIAREMYTTYNIPLGALSAAGGWWAGHGNFYYAIQEGDSLAIMHAARGQEQDSLGYQYTSKKRFPITYQDE